MQCTIYVKTILECSAFSGWNAGMGRSDWSGSTGSDSYRSEVAAAYANGGYEYGGNAYTKNGGLITTVNGHSGVWIDYYTNGDKNRYIDSEFRVFGEQGGDLPEGLNAFVTALRNLADHAAEEAFFEKYWSKIPGYKKNLVSGDISGQRRFDGGTKLSNYKLSANLSGWIQNGKDGVKVYLNLVGATDATITNYWRTDNLQTFSGDIRFRGGPAILLRSGEVDVFIATFGSVSNQQAFFNQYYTQRYDRRFDSFKKAYKNYIGN